MSRTPSLPLLAIASLLVVGCVAAPPASESSSALGAAVPELFANDKAAFDFFVGKGLTNFQAAGIVGNLDQESGVDPTIAQYGGGPGRGIAQWSTGGRWDTGADSVASYANAHGESIYGLQTQLEFIWFELTTYGYGFSQLKATTNVTDATVVFMDKYEICGTCDQTNRVNYANAVLNAYGATPDWAASYVSQSWPLASQPALQLKCGESVAAKIVLKNVGAKAWTSATKLGTTMQRDRASIFAGSDWLAPNRAATSGNVAPGADGTFAFSFHGPTGSACVPGTYHEFFGVVQDGVAWFSDNGQGGPPDNQIEAVIELQAAPPTGGGGGGGTGGGNGGSGGTGGGTGGGGTGGTPTGTGGGSTGGGADNPESGGAGTPTTVTAHGGCSVATSAPVGDGAAVVFLATLLALGLRRRGAR